MQHEMTVDLYWESGEEAPWSVCMQMCVAVGELKMMTTTFEMLVCLYICLLLVKNPSTYSERVEQSKDKIPCSLCQRQIKSEAGGKAEGEVDGSNKHGGNLRIKTLLSD